MTRIVRAALTETRNAYPSMPSSRADLAALANQLEDIRTANLAHHEALIVTAHQAGTRIIGLGELFAAPYFALDENSLWHALAESAHDGPSVTLMQRVARTNDIVIVAPIYEIDPTTGRRFNTAVVIDADGTIVGSYRKTHIPCGTNETGSFHETFYYERSDGTMPRTRAAGENRYFPVFPTAVGTVGVAICYDRHFEGVMSTLATAGAEIVFSPAVTFGTKSELLWPQEFQTDAMRHRLFIGGSNRRGAEAPWNIEYFGGSGFWGPDGPLDNLGTHPDLVISDLDLGTRHDGDTSGWDLARDRRPDIYDG